MTAFDTVSATQFHRSVRRYGLVPAVNRIVAILLIGLDLIDMNGPRPTLALGLKAAVLRRQSCRS